MKEIYDEAHNNGQDDLDYASILRIIEEKAGM